MIRSIRWDARRVLRQSALAAPVIALTLGKLLLPAAGPGQARAQKPEAIPELDAVPVPVPETLWTDRRRVGLSDRVASPFYVPQRGGQPSIEPGSQLESPTFALSAVLSGAGGSGVAVIDGRPALVGKALGGGWTVESIDPTIRQVSLIHPTGERMVLTLAMPGLGEAAPTPRRSGRRNP